jgi:outer membrane protein assembly factor BamB
MGRGYSSPSNDGNILYVTGEDNQQFVLALRVPDAGQSTPAPEILWKTPIGPGADVGYPGSRCTPTIDGPNLFITTSAGDVAAVDRATGKILWKKSMPAEFGGTVMGAWGFSESPLVDGDKVIVTPGSNDAAVVALNKTDGSVIWKTPVANTGGAGYSSLVISEGAGIRQYVTLLGRGLVGVAADDGKLLWTYDKIANQTANIPTAIVRGDYVFGSTGYQAGSALLKLSRDGRGVKAKEVYFLQANRLQNHHGGMVLVGDHLYGGHGHNQGFPVCVDFETGKIAWREKRGIGEGSAAVTYADGHLYFRYQNGIVVLIEAAPKGYKQKGSFQIPDVTEPSWPHPVIAGGILYLREQDRMLAYDCRQVDSK